MEDLLRAVVEEDDIDQHRMRAGNGALFACYGSRAVEEKSDRFPAAGSRFRLQGLIRQEILLATIEIQPTRPDETHLPGSSGSELKSFVRYVTTSIPWGGRQIQNLTALPSHPSSNRNA